MTYKQGSYSKNRYDENKIFCFKNYYRCVSRKCFNSVPPGGIGTLYKSRKKSCNEIFWPINLKVYFRT